MTKFISMLALGPILALGLVFGTPNVALAAGPHVDGEVMKVDMDAKKVTIKHGPIESLKMPGMTMIFQVADPAMLNQLKAGDVIHFVPDRVNGAFTVISFEKRAAAAAGATDAGKSMPMMMDGHKH